MIKSTAYVFDKIAYISDCSGIYKKDLKFLKNLDYLIIDCLRKREHPSHFNFNQAINLIQRTNPNDGSDPVAWLRREVRRCR